jgi:Caspase domain
MTRLAAWLVRLAALLAFAAIAPTAHAGGALRRIAVVVGANEPPPGRQPLRFAHEDAREVAEVLEHVGGFASADVHILLDPRPPELVAALDGIARTVAGAGGDALVVFYYSGHSDGQSLFPHGEPISLADLRSRIEHLGARIRVGILDTCHGGGWTQSKGLTVGPPLADLLNVDTEGTALVSSSSGLENAHEAEVLHGSFFTHHLVAGLRGAADSSHDGNVTLQEAFDYARERTVRDSARIAPTPQHPSFDLALRGRQDIVLTSLSAGTSALQISAGRALLEVIHLQSGATVADAPAGQGAVRVALPPGRYLVRAVLDGHVSTKEIEVRAGETATVSEDQLEASGDGKLGAKGPEVQAPLSIWNPPRGTHWLLVLDGGVGGDAVPTANVKSAAGTQSASSFTGGYTLWYRITDRLQWSVPWPAFSYRFGTAGSFEVIPYVGLAAGSFNTATGPSVGATADVAARIWTTRSQHLVLRAGLLLPPYQDPDSPLDHFGMGHELKPFASVGYAWTIKKIVTLGADVALDRDYFFPLGAPAPWQYQAEWLRFGGTVDVRLARRVGLSLRAAWSTEEHAGLGSYPGFLVGTTLAF